MKTRSTLSVCLAAMVGFLLGVMFVRQIPVKAQSGTRVAYKQVFFQDTGTEIPSAKIVGFSCVPEGHGNVADCYVAYTTP